MNKVSDETLTRLSRHAEHESVALIALELIARRAADGELQAWREHGKRLGFCAGHVGLDPNGKWSVFQPDRDHGGGCPEDG